MNRSEIKGQAMAFIRVWENSFAEKTEEFQRAAIFVYCEKHKLEVENDFGEIVGADGVPEITPVFVYLLKRFEDGEINKVIVSDYEVLGCDERDVDLRLTLLRNSGVEVISVMEAVKADPGDEMMLKLIVYLTKAMIEKDIDNMNVVMNYIENYYSNFPYGNSINGGEAV